MSIASPIYLCLATGCDRRKLEGDNSMSGKGGEQRSGLARLPSLQAMHGQAWIGSTADLSGFGDTGGAGSLRRRPGAWDSEVKTLSHLVAPAPARRGRQRVERGTYTWRPCVIGNAGSPKLVEATPPIWRRSLHSIQCGSVTGLAAGVQSGPSHRHKSPAMAAKPGGVGEKGGSSWCGHSLPEGG